MADKEVLEILPSKVEGEEGVNPNRNLSLEALVLLINTERLKNLNDRTIKEFKELKERQGKVRELHEILRQINSHTSENDELDLKKTPELLEFLKKAKENHGLTIDEKKTHYKKDERERLVSNFNMLIQDLNVQNDMQLQTTSRLTNERYESYQMARSILKPLHEDKINKARAIHLR